VHGAATGSSSNQHGELDYGLHHLVKVHFAKEEEIYLPILEERLSPDEATAMFNAMTRTAHHH